MTDQDTDILARTIVGEARGEGQLGMSDVACVVMNRAQVAEHYVEAHGRNHPLFGDGSPASACQAPWQFSCWNAGDPNRAVIEALNDTIPIFPEALAIAQSAISGQIDDRTQGATHYYDRRMPAPPAWAAGKTPCFTEGHHLFFNDIS